MVNTILHIHDNISNDPFFFSPTGVSLLQGNSSGGIEMGVSVLLSSITQKRTSTKSRFSCRLHMYLLCIIQSAHNTGVPTCKQYLNINTSKRSRIFKKSSLLVYNRNTCVHDTVQYTIAYI